MREYRKRLCLSLCVLGAVFFLATANTFAQSNLDDLRNKITNGSVEDKRNALLTIRNLRTEDASRIAVPAINDPNELVRATAVSAVVFLLNPDAAELLIPLLKDKAEFVRSEAAYALGEVGYYSVTEPLIQTLRKDRSASVRAVAAAALGKTRNLNSFDVLLRVSVLVQVLKQKPTSANEYLRRSSSRSIGQIAQILRTGMRRVVTPQNFLPEKYKYKNPDAEPMTKSFPAFRIALPILIKVLSNPKEADDVRREAAFALGAIGDASSRKVLSDHLSSPDIYLAEICKEALLNIGRDR